MRPHTAILASLATAVQSAACAPEPCTEVHVFLIRGTNEPYPGRSLSVAEAICADLDCSWSNVEYPATFQTYCDSASTGVESTTRAVDEYAERCPESKIVLSGFSQGGHIVGDVLGGSDTADWEDCTQPASNGLDPESLPGKNVLAAFMWGSPRHNANQTYNLLVGSRAESLKPRNEAELESLNRWEGKLRDYCNLDDPACAQGSDWDEHENYFGLYQDDAAQFVKFKLCG